MHGEFHVMIPQTQVSGYGLTLQGNILAIIITRDGFHLGFLI